MPHHKKGFLILSCVLVIEVNVVIGYFAVVEKVVIAVVVGDPIVGFKDIVVIAVDVEVVVVVVIVVVEEVVVIVVVVEEVVLVDLVVEEVVVVVVVVEEVVVEVVVIVLQLQIFEESPSLIFTSVPFLNHFSWFKKFKF